METTRLFSAEVTEASADLVKVSVDQRVGTLLLDHSDKLNCLSRALMVELIAGLEKLEREGAYVIVLRARAGVKVWSAGHDIHELPEPRRDPLSYGDPLETLLRAISRTARVPWSRLWRARCGAEPAICAVRATS